MGYEFKFVEQGRTHKAREAVQASFFTNASLEDDSHAFVRECIQNSLDAKSSVSQEVTVRLYIGTLPSNTETVNRYLGPDAWEHIRAGLDTTLSSKSLCKYLVYEDFGTTGLVGDINAYQQEEGNAFYYFFRAEGQSGKKQGAGRHGLGKFVIPYLSQIRSFFAATVRESDSKCLLVGQSVLRSHSINNKCYTPDGWWGTFDNDGFQKPIEDQTAFLRFKNDFKLNRNADQHGLSVVVPYVRNDIELSVFLRNILSEYFVPILSGRLIVDLADDKIRHVIKRDNLISLVEGLDIASSDKILPFAKLAEKSINNTSIKIINIPNSGKQSAPTWNKENYLNIEVIAQIKDSLASANGECIKIRAPLTVKCKADNTSSDVYLELLIEKAKRGTSLKPIFVRENITVTEDRLERIGEYICLSIIERNALSTMLGDAENPAHTEWEKNAEKFKNKYEWGPSTIDFIRLSFKKIIKALSEVDDDIDHSILSDIFSIDENVEPEDFSDIGQSEGGTREKKKDKINIRSHKHQPPREYERYYKLDKMDGGFHISGQGKPASYPRRFNLSVAYAIANATMSKALDYYQSYDFSLDDTQFKYDVTHEELYSLYKSGNKIEFVVLSPNFSFAVTGFDNERDVVVRVVQEATDA